jgi:hypothetical protein
MTTIHLVISGVAGIAGDTGKETQMEAERLNKTLAAVAKAFGMQPGAMLRKYYGGDKAKFAAALDETKHLSIPVGGDQRALEDEIARKLGATDLLAKARAKGAV